MSFRVCTKGTALAKLKYHSLRMIDRHRSS